MTKIEIIDENTVRLTRGQRTATAHRDSYDGSRRWYFENRSHWSRFVGLVLSWRINRAQARALHSSFWEPAVPTAVAMERLGKEGG